MDLNQISKDFDDSFGPRWFTIGSSKLKIGYAPKICPQLSSSAPVELSLDELAIILSEHVLTDWSDVFFEGNELNFSKKVALNSLRNDSDFLKLVTSIAFDSSNF